MLRIIRNAVESTTPARIGETANITVPTAESDSDDSDPKCTNVDIRNDLRRLREIENCTVINGFFQMVLIERVESSEFEKYTFKKLREVTGYMLFFRVMNLVTLRRMFPQLAVIRGQQLIGNYALVFYYMEKMIELGLKNLIAIERGFVFTMHCPQLCHLDTIDWNAISGLKNGTSSKNTFEPPKSVCNNSSVCRSCEPKFCWGSESCQKFYKGYNFNHRIKCHPQCNGGCTGTSATECNVCRGWKEGKRCVEQCSAERLLYRPTKRCITHADCLQRNGLFFKNECVGECPAGYSATNVEQEQADFSRHMCYPCPHRCPKVCDGTEIMYLSDADRIRGCTIINGTLHIRLMEDHPNLMEELRNGLGEIEEIMGILKVFRSTFIPSLEFLANLQIIHGADVSENTKFSLMVYENSNLQRLWNYEQKLSLRLDKGGMYFNNNKLLCNAQIKLLRRITEYDNTSDAINWSTNGYMQACHVQSFHAQAEVLSSRNVTIYWARSVNIKTHHRLLGYLINYIRTEVDRTPYEDRELCSKFGWKSRLIPLENVSIEGRFYAYNLTRLKPFTRYGCYVQTYYNESVNSATDMVGLSDMVYFKTPKDRPIPPKNVRTVRKNETSITLAWHITKYERAMVSFYHVDVFIQPDEVEEFDRRNFCTHPHQPRAPQSEPHQGGGGVCCGENWCCCDQSDYEDELEKEDEEEDEEEEEEEEDEDELNGSDEFFNEQTQAEDGGRAGGRKRKKRSTAKASRKVDDFESSMLKLLKTADTHNDHYARRTRRDVDADMVFVNRVLYRDFTADNYETTIPGLKPFTRYIFQLFACCDLSCCSSYSLHTERTNPSPYLDRLNVTIETGLPTVSSNASDTVANNTADSSFLSATNVKTTNGDRIELYFPEPTDVNSLTVAYRVELEVINGTHVSRHTECFTRLEHERNQHRYRVPDVTFGEYLMRAQMISLAGEGPFSEWMMVRVVKPQANSEQGSTSTGLRDGLITFGVVLLLFGCGGGLGILLYRRWRHRRRTAQRDDKIPLAMAF
uniref:receptor protein-tyrosine kinase n=1 Tax=Anopheles epiroticus TaxID=199890 RepID=A0A182PE85_9DIPT